jgi:hypothetical protein
MDMPIRIATREISKPIPENNAIVVSALLSDFEPVVVETGVEIRAAFGMSGSPMHQESKVPTHW